MNTRTIVMLAAVASVAVCAIETRAIFAQPASQAKQSAYYISEFELSDPEGIKPYSQQVEATFTPFSGRYLVRGGQTATLEGEQPKRIVVIAFDSMAQAQAWYKLASLPCDKADPSSIGEIPVDIVQGTPEAR